MATQLTYNLTTSPNPLQVNGTNASMTVIASAQRSGATNIQSITVMIPLGTGSQSLADTNTQITAQGPNGWTLNTPVNNGVFTFYAPSSGDNGLSGGLVFLFTGITVNASEGTATVTIEENEDSDAQRSFRVSKFPADFQLSPLTVTPTVADPGDTATVSWSGSAGYTYTLSPGTLFPEGTADNLPNAGSLTTNPLTENAIITLTVSNGDNQDSFVTQEVAGVTVNRPSISGFTIDGGTTLDDAVLGAVVDLAWQTQDAESVAVFCGSQIVGFFASDDPAPQLTVILGGDYYAVAYYGPISGGIHSPPSDPVLVTLAPPTATLALSSDTVYADYSSVTLNWTTQNATSAKLQIGSQGGEFTVALQNTDYAVYPQGTTLYTLTATYDPDEAITQYPVLSLTAPSAMLAQSVQATGVVTVQASTQVTMKPCPLVIYKDTLYPGNSVPHALSNPVTKVVSFIGGFNFTYKNGDKHDLMTWNMKSTTTLSDDGLTATVSATMVLSDHSDHNISSGSTLDLITVCWNDDNTSAYLDEITASVDDASPVDYSYTIPISDYRAVESGITRMAFFAQTSGDDGKVSSMSVQSDEPTPNSQSDTGTNSVDVQMKFSGGCSGEIPYYYKPDLRTLVHPLRDWQRVRAQTGGEQYRICRFPSKRRQGAHLSRRVVR